MIYQHGLIPRVAATGPGIFKKGEFDFFVSYEHPIEEHRYLRSKINDVGRLHTSLRYTELEDISLVPLGDRKKLVFVTDDDDKFIHRYFKKNDIFYMEKDFSYTISSKFPGCRPIESSRFEKLISQFAEEFFLVLQQDKILNAYLNNSLNYFRDDFIKLGGVILPCEEEELIVNS